MSVIPSKDERCHICELPFSSEDHTCTGCGWERDVGANSRRKTVVISGAVVVWLSLVAGISYYFMRDHLGVQGLIGSISLEKGGIQTRLSFLSDEKAAQANAQDFATLSDREVLEASTKCTGEALMECQIKHWAEIHRRNPNDPSAKANLGIRLAQLDLPDLAIPYLKAAIEMGSGGYDTFAWYANMLRRKGQTEEAISWAYRTLDLQPNLMDITSSLAEMLVVQKRPWEALGLLAGFQEKYGEGRPIFQSRIVGISLGIPHAAESNSPQERQTIRIPEVAGHFFLPIIPPGQRTPLIFMVDTGASLTLIPRATFEKGASFKIVEPARKFQLANGERIDLDIALFDEFPVLGFPLKNVRVALSKVGTPLLGQNVLSQFDLRTEARAGRRFLLLTPSLARP